MPVTYIGDLPRKLLLNGDWIPLKVDIKGVRCGDILFVSHKKSQKLLTHVAIFLEANKIFHCSLCMGTAQIQTELAFFQTYEQKFNFRKMVRYIDQRNKNLRTTHGGAYIKD
jgi:hypothetical protein